MQTYQLISCCLLTAHPSTCIDYQVIGVKINNIHGLRYVSIEAMGSIGTRLYDTDEMSHIQS